MRETAQNLSWLQELIENSIQQAGAFLRESFEMPDKSLNAQQLAMHLRGQMVVSLATVTAKSEPRVAPIGAIFYLGRFHIPTVAQAARTRHLLKRPTLSLTYYEGIDFAVLIHGQAEIVRETHDEFVQVDAIQIESGASSPTSWGGDGVYIRVHPDVLYSYARYPDQFPQS